MPDPVPSVALESVSEDDWRLAFIGTFQAIAACEAPEGTQLDDVLNALQALYNRATGRNQPKHRGDVVLYIDAHDVERCATCSSTNVGAVERGSNYYNIRSITDGEIRLKHDHSDTEIEFVCWASKGTDTECPPMSVPEGYTIEFG